MTDLSNTNRGPTTIRDHAERRRTRMLSSIIVLGRDPASVIAEEVLLHFILDATGRGGISETELTEKATQHYLARTLAKNPDFVLTARGKQMAATNVANFLQAFGEPVDPDNPDDAEVIRKDKDGKWSYVLDGGRDPNDPDLNRSVDWDEYQTTKVLTEAPTPDSEESAAHTHLI